MLYPTQATTDVLAGIVLPSLDGKMADQGSLITGWLPRHAERQLAIKFNRLVRRMCEGFTLTFGQGRITFSFPVAQKTLQEIRRIVKHIEQVIREELGYHTTCIN
jgi:hypothetical protein